MTKEQWIMIFGTAITTVLIYKGVDMLKVHYGISDTKAMKV